MGHGAAPFDRVALTLEFYDGEIEILPGLVAGRQVVGEKTLSLFGLALLPGGKGSIESGELVETGCLGGGESLGEKAQVLDLPVFEEHAGAALTEAQGRVRTGLGVGLEFVGGGAQGSVGSVHVEFHAAGFAAAVIGHSEVLPLAG